MRRPLLIILVLLVLLFRAGPAIAWDQNEDCSRATGSQSDGSQRLALIIANSDYNGDGTNSTSERASEALGFLNDLRNPANDGMAMCNALGRLGFDIAFVQNATREGMATAIARFAGRIDRAPPNAIVVFYYSGHAIQVGGTNYMLPASARLARGEDLGRLSNTEQELRLRAPAIALNEVFLALRPPGAGGLNLVILDSCRDNPWARSVYGSSRGVRVRGLAEQLPELSNTIVAFSTAAGQVAADGSEIEGANSPYTAALLQWIERPGVDVVQMVNEVGRSVVSATGQRPIMRLGPIDPICLAGCGTLVALATRPSQHTSPAPQRPIRTGGEVARVALERTSPRDWSVGYANVLVRSLLQKAPFSAFRALAESGDARAQWVVAAAYYEGIGVGRNREEATVWLQRAAAQGDPRGQNGMGVLAFATGDYSTAMMWHRRAANQGSAIAQASIGWLYGEGLGVSQDYAQAMDWYRRAADQGHSIAQYNIGDLYARGHGVPRDYARAAMWFRRAADQGHGDAQYNLGVMLSAGFTGVPRNPAEGRRLITQAASGGIESARRWLVERGIEPPVPAP